MALTVVDASVVIALFDERDAHHAAAKRVLREHESDDLVLPATAYSEMLVLPARQGEGAIRQADRALEALGILIEPIGGDVARRAASLRSDSKGLRLPDAIVIATAEVLGAGSLLTADHGWTRVSELVRVIA